MKIFFDTEFIEDGKTIDLISIGMVREDGAEFYAVSSEFDESKANDWAKKNVLPKIAGVPRMSRQEIKRGILLFVGTDKPEFWAYYADYDWVALCQLYGRMIDLPKGWPMFCLDFKQWLWDRDNMQVVKLTEKDAHNALDDARWLMSAYARAII